MTPSKLSRADEDPGTSNLHQVHDKYLPVLLTSSMDSRVEAGVAMQHLKPSVVHNPLTDVASSCGKSDKHFLRQLCWFIQSLAPEMRQDIRVAVQLTCLTKLFLVLISSLTQFTAQSHKAVPAQGKGSQNGRNTRQH